MNKINLNEKFNLFDDIYVPKIAAELNGQYVKLAKFKGPYVMHSHENEDEMFLVVRGSFVLEYEDHSETINEGEFVVVPKGVRHKPVADEVCDVIIFEPISVVNTGEAESEYTIAPENLERI